MLSRFKSLLCFALMASAMGASAFIPEHNLTNRQDAKAQSTGYFSDGMNRIDRIEYPDATQSVFDHDANGNLTLSSNETAEVTFAYDEMNRLTVSTQSVYSVSSVVRNSYDLNGNRTNIVYPGGLNVSYSYDEENRLTGTVLTGSPISTPLTFSFGYDGASRLAGMSYPNGINSTFGYDAENKVVSYNHGAFVNHSITRDLRGYKTQEDIYAGLIPNFTNGMRQTRTHNDADQLLSAGANEYSYDPNGNLTNSANGIYQWNYDNRLVNAGSTEYLYDGSGSRIGRIANGVTNYFILDYKAPLKMPLAETDAQGNITRYYIWSSHGLLAHLDMNPTNGAIVATRYYHADEQGSTLAMTDESGAVTEQFAYSPYGQTIGHTGTNSTPYQWLGGIAVRNEGNGLYYMLNRYYSADMRRFISADPSGIDGGANLYSYAGLNPLFYTDPFGLEKTSIGSRLSGVAKGVGMMAAGFVPYLGDAMDMYDVASPNSSALTRSLSGASLAVNVWTAGLAPNLGPIRRGASMVGDAFSGTTKATKTIDPSAVRFSQSSISRNFSSGGSVDDLAGALRSGATKANDVPAIRLVERDGQLFTLDNRRLEAFRRAEVEVPYQMATPEDAAAEAWKFTTQNGGVSIRVRGQ